MSDVKQPEDHKQPANAPYIWTSPEGRQVTLKPFDRLPSGVFRNARNLTDLDATFALIEAGTDEAGLAVIDELPLGDLEGLFADWSSGATLPQS